jgi:hypothetical protein
MSLIKYGRMRWVGYVARVGERRGAYRVLMGKPEGRRPLLRPSHRERDIKMNLKGRFGGMDWIDLAQDRDKWRAVVRKVTILHFP